jgi:hypothetical protein
MTQYKCEKCNRVFSQRSHYTDHMNKKIDCKLQTAAPPPPPPPVNEIEYPRLAEDEEDLYDLAFPEEEEKEKVPFEKFRAALTDLVGVGYVRQIIHEDKFLYTYSQKHTWDDIKHIDCSIKKQIIQQFIESPNTFFILQNTQRGKSRLCAIELSQWTNDKTKRPVTFIMLSNDQTLGDQSLESFKKHKWVDDDGNEFILQNKVKSYHLSSSASVKTDIQDVITYIDAYAANDDYSMPLITYLSNEKQNKKVLELLHYIKSRAVTRYPNLQYAILIDEADENYPRLRDKQENIQGSLLSLKDFTYEDTSCLYRLGFVTATEGTLLDKYPECANAYHSKPRMDEADTSRYRGIHSSDSIKKLIQCKGRSNNAIFLDILKSEEYKAHFEKPVTLKSGDQYYRKIIFNSDNATSKMKAFAKEVTHSNKYYAITFNQAGLTIYKSGRVCGTYRTKGKYFNKLLFYLYKQLELDDKPLIILGRKKVDRGLGFHYAPRSYIAGPKHEVIKFDDIQLGELHSEGEEGLIWTDVFLGKIEATPSAVQKAGRGAGIIAQCPQYIGSVTYWTDEATANAVIAHNIQVEHANSQPGSSTMLQSMNRAKEAVTEPIKQSKREKHKVTSYLEPFPSMEALNRRWKEISPSSYDASPLTEIDNKTGKIKCSLGAKGKVQTCEEIEAKLTDAGISFWGTGYKSARVGTFVHRVYIGYNGDTPTYYLRWAKREDSKENENDEQNLTQPPA